MNYSFLFLFIPSFLFLFLLHFPLHFKLKDFKTDTESLMKKLIFDASIASMKKRKMIKLLN